MWIYFVEQVWCYDPDEWSRLGWRTHEYQARYWDHWHYHEYPDGTPAYRTMHVYNNAAHLQEGEDYIDF